MTISKRVFLPTIFFFLLFSLQTARAGDFPKPRGSVNDFAAVISPDIEEAIRELSIDILDKTGTSVVVATFPDIERYDIEDFTNRLYEKWGIGKKGEDKGVLILLALKERKIRIETGFGVEGIIPDGMAGAIIDNYVLPDLRQARYGKGLLKSVIAIGQILAKDAGVEIGKYGTLQKQPKADQSPGTFSGLLFLIFIIILFSLGGRGALPLLLLSGGLSRQRGGFGSGGFSGGFGGFGGGLSGGGGATRGF